jgi:hypothetical protein
MKSRFVNAPTLNDALSLTIDIANMNDSNADKLFLQLNAITAGQLSLTMKANDKKIDVFVDTTGWDGNEINEFQKKLISAASTLAPQLIEGGALPQIKMITEIGANLVRIEAAEAKDDKVCWERGADGVCWERGGKK